MEIARASIIVLISVLLFVINIGACCLIVQEEVTFEDSWEEFKTMNIGEMLVMLLCIPSLSFLIFYNLMKWKPFGDK